MSDTFTWQKCTEKQKYDRLKNLKDLPKFKEKNVKINIPGFQFFFIKIGC